MRATHRRTLATLIALAALSAVSLRAGDWPGWRGPNRDALADESGLLDRWGPDDPPLLWQASGTGAGFASVAIVGERIYTLGDIGPDQYVIAVSRADGSPVWRTRIGPAHDEDPRRGGARATPTVDGERVYAIGTEGDLVCLEAATGKQVWHRSLPDDFGGQMMSRWKFSESPLVDGDRLVFTPGMPDAALVAVDKRTGKQIWRAAIPDLGEKGKDGAGYSGIVVSHGGGVKQYVQLLGRGVVGIRASDGKFLWGYNRVANDVANVSTPVVRGDLVFVSTGYQTGSALLELKASGDGVSATERYFLEPTTFQNHHGGFVLVGDHVYGGHGHNKGFPICIELDTGRVVWGGDIRNQGTGSAAVLHADGNLYFRYENGMIVLVEATPARYVEKGMLAIPDVRNPSWAHLVVLDGRLYVREQDRLYCYDLRAPGAAD